MHLPKVELDQFDGNPLELRLITDAQYGFVKGRSTELQFLNCSKMWINAIDSNKFVETVYIDFFQSV